LLALAAGRLTRVFFQEHAAPAHRSLFDHTTVGSLNLGWWAESFDSATLNVYYTTRYELFFSSLQREYYTLLSHFCNCQVCHKKPEPLPVSERPRLDLFDYFLTGDVPA